MNGLKEQGTNFSDLNDDGIDFKRYISLFISNWYWFAIALFVSLSIAYGINRWSEEVYTVSSTLLIKDDQIGGAGSGSSSFFPGFEAFQSRQTLNNEIGILRSYKLNYPVIDSLKDFHIDYIRLGKRGFVETRLYKACPFIVDYDSLGEQIQGRRFELFIISEEEFKINLEDDPDSEVISRFGEKLDTLGYKFTVNIRFPGRLNYNPEAPNKFYFRFLNPASIANSYRRKLVINPIDEEASLVTLSTTGFVPSQEADYLNRLMLDYLDFGLATKNQTANQTLQFIEDQLKIVSDSLTGAERNLELFRLENKLIDISRDGLIIQNKVEQIDEERTTLLLRRNYYVYLKEYLDSKKETADIIAPSIMGISDQLLVNMISEFSALLLQKMKLSMNLEDSSAPLNVINGSINSLRIALNENVTNGIASIDRSIQDIDRRIDGIEMEIRKLPVTERKMITIQRKFDVNNSVYTYLLEKRAEASIAKASNVSDNIIIDTAGPFTSTRIKPKERQNYMMAIVLGLFLPILIIVLIDYLNDKIIDKKDIEKATNAPVIGFISHNTFKSEIPVREKPGSTLSESFRSVRTNLKYFLKDVNNPVISVTSTITAEGKTFISTNIAAIIASLGKKVLLIGLDLRKPRTHKILNSDNRYGISNFLAGEGEFEDVIQKSTIQNLWYAPSGPIPPNPAELIESEGMKNFIERARKDFDYIVIDTPPVAIVTDALLLSSVTDLYIFVVRQRYTSKRTIGLIEELYKNENIKKLGILVNDISLTGYYGYGLRYGYAGGYGYSYGYNYYGDPRYSGYGYTDNAKGYFVDEGV